MRTLAFVLGGPRHGGWPGDLDELPVYGHLAAQHVQPVHRQTEHLALAQSRAGRERHHRAQPGGDGVPQCFDLLGRRRSHLHALGRGAACPRTGSP